MPTLTLRHDLGERLRRLRIQQGLTQPALAARANTGVRAVRNLERGDNSTTDTLVRVLRALGAESDLAAIAPMPSVEPMALLRGIKRPQRSRKPRKGA